MLKRLWLFLFGPRVLASDYPAQLRTLRICKRCGHLFQCRTSLTPQLYCTDLCREMDAAGSTRGQVKA